MSNYGMFSIYLNERLTAKGMTVPELSKKLGYKVLMHVPHWFDGTGLPRPEELHQLATLLDADPVVLSLGWLISQAPELEDILQEEVLAGRAEKLPGGS